MKRTALLAGFLLFCALQAHSQYYLDAEGGRASAANNTVRIPSDGGTRLSLTEDLKADPALYIRFRIGRVVGKHDISLLIAPLTLNSEGVLRKDVSYNGKTFAAGINTKAEYRFNSYRIKYLYTFRKDARLVLKYGGALKMRHAGIKLQNDIQETEYSNTGLVPLAAFSAEWRLRPGYALLFDLEGLAAPQGRAEDAMLTVQRDLARGVKARLGYRILEGGSGAGEVYTFALVSYWLAGVTWQF
ncbi:MAG TPA: hypothetical protein DCL44_08055 [Elusimicrobia bacterium]|nr:hypothetical protein [Elusimicrobiota bacterium]